MKTAISTFILVLFVSVSIAEAQLREDLNRSGNVTGTILKTDHQESSSFQRLFDGVNMEMGHSYSMTLGSVGGQFQNVNAYTNHMAFDFSENLSGNLDVSFLHSPFGNSFSGMGMNNPGLGDRIVIDRAQLDYQLSENTSFSIQFSQRPYYSPYSFGAYNSPFNRRSHFPY